MEKEVISCCSNCMYGKTLNFSNDVICKFNGLLKGNGLCDRYKYNLFIKPPAKKRSLKNLTPEDFSID